MVLRNLWGLTGDRSWKLRYQVSLGIQQILLPPSIKNLEAITTGRNNMEEHFVTFSLRRTVYLHKGFGIGFQESCRSNSLSLGKFSFCSSSWLSEKCLWSIPHSKIFTFLSISLSLSRFPPPLMIIEMI